jgi:hypothetical protein
MTTTRVLAGLVSNGNVLADGTITPAEIGIINISGVTYPGDDQAANPAGGQTITVNGAGFASTPTVYVGGVIAPSVSFISSTQITFTSPAKAAGTYDIYVVNPGGSTAIRVYGISYSGTPTWTTAAGELGPVDANFTIQLVATGDAPLTYALTSGSTLPSGVTLSSAGLITGSALTVEQTFNFSVDAIDAQYQETPRSFAVTVSLADPYFKYVTLLLAGDPAVTPFTADASTNNFNITINGDARSNSFTPYRGDGYYGNYFNGSSDYFSTSQAAGAFGTSDFTIEMWYRSSGGHGTYARVASKGIVGVATTGAWGLGVYRGGNEFYWSSYYSGVFNDITTGINLNDGVWHHIAATRVGTTLNLYSDGVLRASGTIPGSFNFGSTTDPLMVAYQNRDDNYVNGNVSNMRILIGTALYTGSTYTVPTSPLTAITNTVLLTCQSCRFVDKSTNAYTITTSGTPAVTAVQPFTLPSNVATYGSGYFDGNGDYLNVTSTAFGSGDFTLECWVYATSAPSDNGIFEGRNNGTGTTQFTLTAFTGSSIRIYSGSALITASSVNYVNTWCHVAVVRASGTTSLYINGVSAGTSTSLGNLTDTNFVIGAGRYTGNTTPNSFFPGYISNFRCVVGTAVYTTNFTPPTSLLTAITNTQLLTAQYNGGANSSGFRDSSQNNFIVTRNGNATQGAFSPYGANWSNYFNASASRLEIVNSNSSMIAQGTAFTLEAWVFINTSTATGNTYNTSIPFLCSSISSSNNSNGRLYGLGTTTFGFWDKASANWLTISWTPPVGQWFHLALVSTGTVFTLYVNGTSVGSVTDNSTYYADSGYNFYIASYVGNGTSGTPPVPNMYLSNFRYTKAQVYTTNFTPSTTPLTAIANTTVLTCQSNRFIDNSTNAYTVNPLGTTTPSVQRFSPFGPGASYTASTIGGSAYFDGSGDYLTAPSTSGQLGSGDFTVEAYIYPVSRVNLFPTIWGNYNVYTAGALGIFAGHNGGTTSKYQVAINGASFPTIQSTDAIIYNQWSHVAVVRSGTTITLYINGVANGTYTTSATLNGANSAWIGSSGDELINGCFNGYISNSRVVKGTAIYTAAFTPPTAPLTAVTNTQLLLSYTNSGIYDNAMINDLETVGNAQISTSIKKYGTGSIAMLTSSDYCRGSQPSVVGDINGANFTIEFWVYFTDVSANRGLISKYGNTAENAGGLGYVVQFQQSIPSLRFVLGIGGGADAVYDFAWSPSISTWYHVAVTRSGTSARAFINGTQIGSTTTVTVSDLASPNPPQIGKTHTAAQYLLGYMDDIRVTKGYARYTANFTPPAAALKTK